MTKETLTDSARHAFLACKKRYFYAQVMRLRREYARQAMSWGTCFDAGVEQLHKSTPPQDAAEFAVAKWFESIDPTDSEAQANAPVHATILCQMLLFYAYYWREDDARFNWVAPQETMRGPILNPDTGHPMRRYDYAGKLDGRIVERSTGEVLTYEGKTTKQNISPDKDYWRRLTIDSQVTGYVMLQRDNGHRVSRTLYDVVRRIDTSPLLLTQGRTRMLLETGTYSAKIGGAVVPIARYEIKVTADRANQRPGSVHVNGVPAELQHQKKASAIRETLGMLADRVTATLNSNPEQFFQRREVTRTAEDIDELRLDIHTDAQAIMQCHRKGRWPKNTSACLAPGRAKCDYFDLCVGGWNIETSGIPPGFIISDTPHPELEESE